MWEVRGMPGGMGGRRRRGEVRIGEEEDGCMIRGGGQMV